MKLYFQAEKWKLCFLGFNKLIKMVIIISVLHGCEFFLLVLELMKRNIMFLSFTFCTRMLKPHEHKLIYQSTSGKK